MLTMPFARILSWQLSPQWDRKWVLAKRQCHCCLAGKVITQAVCHIRVGFLQAKPVSAKNEVLTGLNQLKLVTGLNQLKLV